MPNLQLSPSKIEDAKRIFDKHKRFSLLPPPVPKAIERKPSTESLSKHIKPRDAKYDYKKHHKYFRHTKYKYQTHHN